MENISVVFFYYDFINNMYAYEKELERGSNKHNLVFWEKADWVNFFLLASFLLVLSVFEIIF